MRAQIRAHHACGIAVAALLATVLAAPLCPATPAWADEVVAQAAPGAMGSITLIMENDSNGPDAAMEGGQLALYSIAPVSQDGTYYDLAQGQFAGELATSLELDKVVRMTSEELDDVNDSVSMELEEAVAEHGISPFAVSHISAGQAYFASVPQGLYLVMQIEDSEGGRTTNAFLMTVPDGDGALDVVARPKPGAMHIDDQDDNGGGTDRIPGGEEGDSTHGSPIDSPTSSSTGSSTFSTSAGSHIPTMGDIIVNVVNLVLLGLIALLVGIALRLRARNTRHRGA